MKKIFIYLCLLICISNVKSQNFTKANIEFMAQYIDSLQFKNTSHLESFGAIKKCNDLDIINGQYYFQIVPYFSHIAGLGILKSNYKDKCNVVLRWLNWRVGHCNRTTGQMLNYYYKKDGSVDATCPVGSIGNYCNWIDAEDSESALFWALAKEYYTVSKDKSFFFKEEVRKSLESSADYLVRYLKQPNNLFIAKKNCRVVYTMDNSEVFQGFLSLYYIEANIYGNDSLAKKYATIANNIKAAIKGFLFSTSQQLYYTGFDMDSNRLIKTNPANWYNESGIVEALWPQLWSIDSPNDSRSVNQRSVLKAHFKDWTHSLEEGDVWASVGYIFSLGKDTVNGYAQANYISSLYVKPFHCVNGRCNEAGWLIMNMATKFPARAMSKKLGVNK